MSKSKVVVITGASSGLGEATAYHLASLGAKVVLGARREDKLQQIAAAIEAKGGQAAYLATDVTKASEVKALVELAVSRFGQLDVIINNAGVGYRSFVELSEDKKIDTIVDINWLGVVKVCRAFIPVFREQNFGQFITISSIAGLVNLPLGSFYHSTKQAVESFSECMAYELLDFNISVSTVQFGNAPTSFQANVTKCNATEIDSYNKLMDKVTAILHKKTKKNTNLTPIITKTLFNIAENPKKNFKRYTIGFDANFMSFIRRLLGYKLFNSLIRKSVLGHF